MLIFDERSPNLCYQQNLIDHIAILKLDKLITKNENGIRIQIYSCLIGYMIRAGIIKCVKFFSRFNPTSYCCLLFPWLKILKIPRMKQGFRELIKIMNEFSDFSNCDIFREQQQELIAC